MTTPRINIECIKAKDVYEFTCTAIDSREPDEVVPASRWRSLAWMKNPFADEDDVNLIVAYIDGRCVGYLGIMPGRMRTGDKLEKIYWLSTFYVSEELRHTAVGALLVMRALTLHKDIVVTNFSDEAARVFMALRFKSLGPLRYMSADFKRVNILGMPVRAIRRLARKVAARPIRTLDRSVHAADWVFKKLVYAPLGAQITPILVEILMKRVEQINDRSFERHQQAIDSASFVRGTDVINWMLRDRWVTNDPSQGTEGYFFRDCYPFFQFVALEIYRKEDESYRGFVVLRVDEKFGKRTVTIFDYYLHDPSDQRYLLPLAVEQAKTVLADEINVPQKCRDAIQQSCLMRWCFHQAEQAYFCYPNGPKSPLNGAPEQLKLDLSDGDTAFA